MRRLLLFALLLAWPSSALAAPALVQHNLNAAGGSSVNVTLGGAVTAGNLVVIGCGADASSGFTISDTIMGSYTVDASVTASSQSVAIAHVANHTGGSATFTCASTGAGHIQAFVAEFSGAAVASVLDGTPTTHQNFPATTSATTGAITTSNANSVVIGYLDTNNPTTIAATGGYTVIDKDEGGAVVGGALIYQVVAAGTTNPSMTLGTSLVSQGATAGYKAAAGGGGGATCTGLLLGVGCVVH